MKSIACVGNEKIERDRNYVIEPIFKSRIILIPNSYNAYAMINKHLISHP